jgi:SAM-dependent methyltransferase
VQWFEAAFGRQYLDLYRHRDDDSAAGEAAFAARALGLAGSAAVLDVACGGGRHARALRAQGHRVVGVDLSRDLLSRATGTTRVRADMRALPFRGSFRAATSFFTSFGYFDEDGNRSALEAAATALRPGGGLFLDFLNEARVRATLVPRSEEELDGRRVRIRRRIEGGRVLKEVSIEPETGRPIRYTESVRLYSRPELVALLAECGLEVEDTFGDFDGAPYSARAPRCILVARRTG